jgi:hypothetical protein
MNAKNGLKIKLEKVKSESLIVPLSYRFVMKSVLLSTNVSMKSFFLVESGSLK